jgi:hypothetical protein
MNTTATASDSPSEVQLETRFNVIWPELQSRAKAMSRRFYPDDEEAESEALASMSANFTLAARRGKWLPPSQLAHYAAIRLRVGRSLTGNCINEPLSVQCRIHKKANVIAFSHAFSPRRSHALPIAIVQRLVNALTSDESENPATRVATRLDWASFLETQPTRIQLVLTGLAEGYSRKEMAERIRVSPGRLTQIMDNVAKDAAEFFPDSAPK